MPVVLDWKQVALRLALAVIAGAVIGINRGERGRPAGLRTTLLVCVAAALSMLQANLLLESRGKAPDSFVVLDLMRLPLGILSGMGFIGAGTILRKGSLVQGVTTAATLWYVTVMGLCFGGGQIGLGLAALGVGLFTLWVLKFVEGALFRDMRGNLVVAVEGSAETADQEVRKQIAQGGCEIISWGMSLKQRGGPVEIRCELQWKARPKDTMPPTAVARLMRDPAVHALSWQPQGLEGGARPGQSGGTAGNAFTPTS